MRVDGHIIFIDSGSRVVIVQKGGVLVVAGALGLAIFGLDVAELI